MGVPKRFADHAGQVLFCGTRAVQTFDVLQRVAQNRHVMVQDTSAYVTPALLSLWRGLPLESDRRVIGPRGATLDPWGQGPKVLRQAKSFLRSKPPLVKNFKRHGCRERGAPCHILFFCSWKCLLGHRLAYILGKFCSYRPFGSWARARGNGKAPVLGCGICVFRKRQLPVAQRACLCMIQPSTIPVLQNLGPGCLVRSSFPLNPVEIFCRIEVRLFLQP